MKTDTPIKCPTCGGDCRIEWSGLDLVENSGDETLATKHYISIADQQNKEKDAEIQRLTKELQEAKTSDGRGWKAVERLQRANDVLRNENDKLKDQLIILKKAYGSKKTNNA